MDVQVTPIGKTDWRNEQKPFGIKDKDRLGHIYAIGKTGTGKTTLMLNMAISDIQKGKGMAFIDPHGDVAEELLTYIPMERLRDLIYFNPQDVQFPIGLNPLDSIEAEFHHLIASGLISTFKRIWWESWGPRMEHILRYSLLTLLQYPSGTLLDVQPLLTDKLFRASVIQTLRDQYLINFWTNEFEKYPPSFRNEAISPILNKLGIFQASLPLKMALGQRKSINMKEVMDQGKILVCNLSKGQLGEDASAILGCILVTGFQLAALARSKEAPADRRPFYLYVDEVHSFITLSFADILAESRKYALGLFIAHQYLDQLPEKVRMAVFGNVGTIISFRIGSEDAPIMSKEFYPVFDEKDLINLPRFSMYLKLMIDGMTSQPFSAISHPQNPEKKNVKNLAIAYSRKFYSSAPQIIDKVANQNTLFK